MLTCKIVCYYSYEIFYSWKTKSLEYVGNLGNQRFFTNQANLSWSRTQAKFCQLILSLFVILLQLKLINLKLEVFQSDFQRKKKDINTDKLAINWQNFARVRL